MRMTGAGKRHTPGFESGSSRAARPSRIGTMISFSSVAPGIEPGGFPQYLALCAQATPATNANANASALAAAPSNALAFDIDRPPLFARSQKVMLASRPISLGRSTLCV